MKSPLKRVALVAVIWMLGWGTAGPADAGEKGRVRLESVAVSEAPRIDGRDSDAAWSFARASRVTVRDLVNDDRDRIGKVILKSVRTASHIYFLVSWADTTRDVTHKTWVWNAEKKAYEQGSDREDVLALAFEQTGRFTANMLSGVEAVWDVWQWKAARTDPAGYAMDKTHVYSKTKPAGEAKSFPARDGSTNWIARPEDEGESPQKSQPAPGAHQGDRVPQYVAGTPSGSAADVRAKGIWNNGRWTVEFARKLATGHADDVVLDGKTHRMALAVFDHEEDARHTRSKVFDLVFVPGRVLRAYVTDFGGGGVSVIDLAGRRRVGRIKTGSKPHGVAIAPDGTAVFVSNEGDGTVSVIDPATNTVTRTIPVGAGPNQLAVSADGRHLFVTLHGAAAVAVVDVAQHRVVKVVAVGRAPHIALRGPDGRTIYVTSEGDMKLVTMDAQTWTVTAEIPLLAFPRVLALTPDGKRVYQTIRWLNGALVVDPRRKKVVDRIALGELVFAPSGKDAHGLAVTPDGKQLWLTTQTANRVTIIRTADHRVIGRLSVGRNPNWVGFTPDGAQAVISNTGSDDVTLVDVRQRRVMATVPVGRSPKRLAVGAVATGAIRGPRGIHLAFDDLTEGQLPAGFKIDATNPRGKLADWAAVTDVKAAGGRKVFALIGIHDRSGGVFNLCWNPGVHFKDGVIEVRVRADTGRIDQGGGVIWRAKDANNYYIARCNPLEGNFRLYHVKAGLRTLLADASGLSIAAGEWFTIRIVHRGDAIEGWLNGKKLLALTDRTFAEAGGVGLWTKADAATSFDDLTVKPAR